MRETWRWFGPADKIAIAEVVQTGVQGIVSALHHVAPGDVWTPADIAQRQAEIAGAPGAPTGLTWDVVESVPVSEDIKTGGPARAAHIEAYCESLENLAAAGISTVCYNFMPVLDWTRTDLRAPVPGGGTAMRFDLVDFVVFDLYILVREGATAAYPKALLKAADQRRAQMSDADCAQLADTIVAGLPGSAESWTLPDLAASLARYDAIDADQLRENLRTFLAAVVPVAERLGMRLCCHPDDPPFPLLGLPRIVSTEDDYAALVDMVPSPANGITFCTGSLGVRADFDPVAFIARLGSHIHFVHLRNTTRQAPFEDGRSSFVEDAHLAGDTDMPATIRALMAEERRRAGEGRADAVIPMRPDHGHALLSDLQRPMMPGYPLIGRMRGLAELRGVMAAVNSIDG